MRSGPFNWVQHNRMNSKPDSLPISPDKTPLIAISSRIIGKQETELAASTSSPENTVGSSVATQQNGSTTSAHRLIGNVGEELLMVYVGDYCVCGQHARHGGGQPSIHQFDFHYRQRSIELEFCFFKVWRTHLFLRVVRSADPSLGIPIKFLSSFWFMFSS